MKNKNKRGNRKDQVKMGVKKNGKKIDPSLTKEIFITN